MTDERRIAHQTYAVLANDRAFRAIADVRLSATQRPIIHEILSKSTENIRFMQPSG